MPKTAEAFSTIGEVRTKPGRHIRTEDLSDIDVLLVRSVTPVGERLLHETPVRFVGSATIGTDHIDLSYLKEVGITFAHAPGANAESVAEYVMAAVLRLAVRNGVSLDGRILGVVGCGNIGSIVARRAEALGLRVLRNDPPLAKAATQAGDGHTYVPLERVLTEADIVTLHVPLTDGTGHPTYHLIGRKELEMLKADAWLINTSRGAVVDNEALEQVLAAGRLGAVVLDVWEGEPAPSQRLLGQVDIGTPHIAGYSLDGKVQGTVMLYEAVVQWLGRSPGWDAQEELQPDPLPSLQAPDDSLRREEALDMLVRQMYDIERDDAALRPLADLSKVERGVAFSRLRKEYQTRRAFKWYQLPEEALAHDVRATFEQLRGGEAITD